LRWERIAWKGISRSDTSIQIQFHDFFKNKISRRENNSLALRGVFCKNCPPMGRHSSLQTHGGASAKKRNVLKRFERVNVLKGNAQWKDGDRVVGLRKTKSV